MSLPVPDTLAEALDPAWLSAALGQRYPGIVVTAVESGPIVSRVSTNARVSYCVQGRPSSGPDRRPVHQGLLRRLFRGGARQSVSRSA